MSIYDDLTRAIKEHGEQFQPKPIRQRGQLGYTVNNVYSVPEPGDTAQYRVRLDNKSFITAYHDGKCAPQPDLSVWVVQDELGRYHIDSVDVTNVSSSNPNNPSQAFTAPHSHGRGSGMEFPIDPRLFNHFQVRIISGLNIYINGGAYQYEGKWKWFGGDTIDLTSYVPVSANQQRWAILTLDHATATITVISGTTQSIASPLTLEQIEPETLKGIPVGAIRLRNGQTGISETDIESLHILVDSFPKHNYTATTDPTTGDDELDGYGISSQWFNQTSQVPYICIDATAGAAVWVSGGGAGGADPIATSRESITTREVIYDSTLTSSGTFTIPISASDDNIEIEGSLRSTVASTSDIIYLEVNGDTTASNYRHTGWFSGSTLAVQVASSQIIGNIAAANSESGAFSQVVIKGYPMRTAGYMREFIGNTVGRRDSGSTNVASNIGLTWRSTNAVTSIVLRPDGGSDNFSAGSRVIAYRVKTLDVVTGVTGTASPMLPIELDYAETIPTNKQIALSHINIITGGELTISGAVVFVGGE